MQQKPRWRTSLHSLKNKTKLFFNNKFHKNCYILTCLHFYDLNKCVIKQANMKQFKFWNGCFCLISTFPMVLKNSLTHQFQSGMLLRKKCTHFIWKCELLKEREWESENECKRKRGREKKDKLTETQR